MASPEDVARKYLSPRSIEIGRLDQYVRCTQYDGRVDWFSTAAPVLERKPCINYPIVKSSIGSHVALTMGEGRWPTLTSATSEDDRSMDEDWGLEQDDSDTLDRFVNVILCRYARLKPIAKEMLYDAMGSKSVAVVVSVRRGRIFAETVRASWCTPALNDVGEVESIEIFYPYIEDFYNDETRRWERRCMLYRRVLDAERDTVYKPALAREDGAMPGSANMPGWSVDKTKTRHHGLGFCPVIWYPFMKPCSAEGTVDGVAIHQHQMGEIDALNMVLSQRHRAAFVAGDPQAFEIGVEPDVNPAPSGNVARTTVEKHVDQSTGREIGIFSSSGSSRSRVARMRGAGVIWRYPAADTKVGYLTIPGDSLKPVDEHARDLRNKIAEALSAVFVDPSEIHTHAAMSGKALSFLFARQTSFDDQVRDDFADNALLPLVSMLLRIVLVIGRQNPRALYIPGVAKVLPILERFERDVANDNDELTGERTWMPPRLEPVWGPYFSPDEAAQLAIVQATVQALQASAITKQMAIEKLASSGVFEVGSAAEVVDAIIEEQQREQAVKDAALHNAVASLGGDSSGPDPTGSDAGGGTTSLDPSATADGAESAPSGGQGPGSGAQTYDASGSKPDRNVAALVYAQLLEDFPANAIAWVPSAHWVGPVEVPIDAIDFSGRDSWRATKEPGKLGEFVERIQGGKRKPIILVDEPNNDKLIVVDGHHRLLAYEKLGEPPVAFVAKVGSVGGPWDEMHSMQRSGEASGPATDEQPIEKVA